MNKTNTLDESTLKLISHKAVDELYECYEVKHSFTMCLYLRFNGDAEDPGALLSKEEFTTLIWKGGEWSTAYDALFQYMVKQLKLQSNE